MKYITHNEGIVQTIFYDEQYVPETLSNDVIAVEHIPDLVEMEGKQAYHFFNGTTVEVKYKTRALTEKERLVEVENVIFNAMMEGKL